ncbi:MAG TPA: glycosyltransferase family 4 protein [Bryobacteraceae bacterium]
MKILVNDFAGHPFQFQLSRELVRRGHKVMHTYFADLSGPKGQLCPVGCEAVRLSVEPLRVGKNFNRYSYLERLKAHRQYVGLLKTKVSQFQPDVVISGNMPTDAQHSLNAECIRRNIRFVHWVQDFYALALETLLCRKLGVLGKAAAAPFHFLERRIFKTCDAVVYISDDFSECAASMNYSSKKAVVIENWASLEDLPERGKNNPWSRAHSLHDKFVFLYSGTMGLKHSPQTLAALARRFRSRPDVRIVLVSEGIGREFLAACKRREALDNLILLDFQPYVQLPEVLASADVLLANVEPESSVFCVPSKILSYLCAGRPILMSVPTQNLAARVIEQAHAGYVSDPNKPFEFLNRAESIWADRALCARMGICARQYAESTFDIGRIGDLFENVLRGGKADALPLGDPVTLRVPQ